MNSTDLAFIPAALSIAGFDPGGGAGIIADIKTFSGFGVYGTSVITTITAQNHTDFSGIKAVDAGLIIKQLESVFSGYHIKAIKIGLMSSYDTVSSIAKFLRKNTGIPVVTDPVFGSTSGKKFVDDKMIELYRDEIFPLSSLVTPNIPELSVLTGIGIDSLKTMISAGRKLEKEFGIPVLAKGGHLKDSAVDVLLIKGSEMIFESEMVKGVNTHGSGCILSAAICAGLAKGLELRKSVEIGKNYISRLLKSKRVIDNVGRVLEPFHETEKDGDYGR